MSTAWDLIVVGAGPAGAAAALGALAAAPSASVLLIDRADFPRDKACGDGIAPHVMDLLATVGVRHLLRDWTPVTCLRLRAGSHVAEGQMRRAVYVVPRMVFDARLVDAAVAAGATLVRHRVRSVSIDSDAVVVDGRFRGRVLVGADGAGSVVRRTIQAPAARRVALAVRGYAPTLSQHARSQVIAFGEGRQPSYAWSFDTGQGVANVGYGELLPKQGVDMSRSLMLRRLDRLLPGVAAGAEGWRGHHLPLSPWAWRPAAGPVLLAGDAAGLINPMTGEGIFYAVATGALAGRSSARALATGRPWEAGRRYRESTRKLLGRHFRHTSVGSWLAARPAMLAAGVDAAAHHRGVFDDIVEIGLGDGLLTARTLAALAVFLPRTRLRSHTKP